MKEVVSPPRKIFSIFGWVDTEQSRVKLSPYCMSRDPPFLDWHHKGGGYACFLGGLLLIPVEISLNYSYWLGFIDFEIFEINIGPTCVSHMTNYDMHKLKTYNEVLGKGRVNQIHRNQFRLFFMHGKFILSRFYCNRYRVCVSWFIREEYQSNVIHWS